MQIHAQKKKTGLVSPRKFVQRVKAENELFSSYMHQVGLTGTGTGPVLQWG